MRYKYEDPIYVNKTEKRIFIFMLYMLNKMTEMTTMVVLLIFLPVIIHAQPIRVNFENQFSGWAMLNFNDPLKFQLGGRIIPTLSLTDSLKNHHSLDVEMSVNAFGSAYFESRNTHDGSVVIKPYRLWLRYAFPRLEFRIGLQKINFGSAVMLRPMMWFDRIDFRDPLQLTDGVYSLLGRYYFQNNANIWLWGLYGNEKTKGWELVPTARHVPEFGGRLQLPVPKGEAAISYHHRTADFSPASDTLPDIIQAVYPEDRIGIDGKWDLGIGLWFEEVIKHNSLDNPIIHEWETYLNLGMDYTFPLGNGLNLTTEYFHYSNKADLTGSGFHGNFNALSVNYPFGLLNGVSTVVYYNWEQHDWYRFINLQRKYDYLSFYLMVFWNPDHFALYNVSTDRNLYAGKGIQFMAVLNL
jgi:hypothetical protein